MAVSDFKKQEGYFLEEVSIDVISIRDLVAIAINNNKVNLTRNEFILALNFLDYLVQKYPIKFLKGPEMVRIHKSTTEFKKWLLKKWDAGKYNDIDFGIWLDMDEQDIPSEYRLDKAITEKE